MEACTALEFQWPYLLKLVGDQADIEKLAVEAGALRRRRGIRSASDLLRVALAYGLCDLSLRQTAAWAEANDIASLSDVALLKRLRTGDAWLGQVLGRMLADQVGRRRLDESRWRLRLVDATCVSKPGSTGTDWRIHLGWELGSAGIDSIELTDDKGGESLERFSIAPGELAIADRGYAHRAGMWSVMLSGGDFIVRLNWQNVPLRDRDGSPFDLLAALRGMPEAQAAEFPVEVAEGPKSPAFDARLAAIRKTEAAAEKSRQRILKEASKKGKSVDPRTLEAAAYVFVLTSLLPEHATATEVLELYRLRWQVELAFKRMKGVLFLDELPAKEPHLARTFLYAKLIGALLLDRYTETYLGFSPWGFPLGAAVPVETAPGVPGRHEAGRRPGATS